MPKKIKEKQTQNGLFLSLLSTYPNKQVSVSVQILNNLIFHVTLNV